MILKQKPTANAAKRAMCKAMGHKWRHVLNPRVFICERCKGRWNTE